ncbi:MAG: ECF transporter S component [Anaerolineales bacterium]|nr:ECF transporter S component [Anaerolineales bacterium]
MSENKSSNAWEFGTRQVVYGAIGAALYGVFSWATNIFPLPAAGNITFRPAVAVLIFFGAAYGPWVGLLAGFIGNTLGDALSGWGFYWNWSLGNGLIGLIAGLVATSLKDYRARADILRAVGYGVLGNAVGLLFASLTEILVGGIDLSTALVGYFTPAFIGNTVVTVVLVPILLIAFAAVASSRGR